MSDYNPTASPFEARRRFYAERLADRNISLDERMRLLASQQAEFAGLAVERSLALESARQKDAQTRRQNEDLADEFRREDELKAKQKDEANRKNLRTALEKHVREKFFENPSVTESDWLRLKDSLVDDAIKNAVNPAIEKTREFLRRNGNLEKM